MISAMLIPARGHHWASPAGRVTFRGWAGGWAGPAAHLEGLGLEDLLGAHQLVLGQRLPIRELLQQVLRRAVLLHDVRVVVDVVGGALVTLDARVQLDVVHPRAAHAHIPHRGGSSCCF
jgi:hypothetical protein